MGKILISNNKEYLEKLKYSFNENHFKTNAVYDQVVVFDKLNISVQNYLETDRGFIACAGTVLYKGQIGKEALGEIYTDICKDGISKVRYNIIGSYVIVLREQKKTYVFVDQLATYTFYYYCNAGVYLCTNNMYHIAETIGAEINKENYLVFATTLFCSGGRTPFNEIFQLMGDKVITISEDEFKIEKLEVWRHDYKFENKEQAIKLLKQKIDNVLSQRSRAFKNELLFLTGGVDSRLEYAMHLYANENIQTAYWIGEDMITNGRQEDADLCRKMSVDFNKKFTLYDVSESTEVGMQNITKHKCDKYGENVMLYGNNQKWNLIFENMENVDFINLGYMGESLREIGDLDEKYHKKYTIKDLAEDMFCRFGMEKELFKNNCEEIYALIEKEIKEDFINGSQTYLSIDQAAKIFTLRRLYTDSKMTNYSNLFCFSFQIFSVPEIWDVVMSIPYEFKQKSAIAMELTNIYKKDLLNYYYFSHHHKENYSIRKKELLPDVKHVLRMKIQPFVVNTKFFDKIMLNKVAKIIYPFTKKNDEIFSTCNAILKTTNFFDDKKIEINYPDSYKVLNLAAYVQQVVFIKMLDVIS